jgi:hypothetical protein
VQRIRKAQVCLVNSDSCINAFIFDESDTDFEVLLADDDHFEVLLFDKDSTLTACGRFQLIMETL